MTWVDAIWPPAAKLTAWLAARKAARVKADDLYERHEIAAHFNDRYCYRVQYEPRAGYLKGSAIAGLLPRGGNRWMCPDCNHVHAPTECSIWSGIQYPKCCTTGPGNRLYCGIRIS